MVSAVAVFSVWINRQALNTDNWGGTSTKPLQNKEVQRQLAIYLSDQLTANVDIEEELQKALPPKLAPLAAPAAGALEQLAPQAAEKALERPKVQELWASANRAAHEALLKVIDGGGPALSTSGGEVTLNLGKAGPRPSGQLRLRRHRLLPPQFPVALGTAPSAPAGGGLFLVPATRALHGDHDLGLFPTPADESHVGDITHLARRPLGIRSSRVAAASPSRRRQAR